MCREGASGAEADAPTAVQVLQSLSGGTRRVTNPILGHSHDDMGLNFGRNLASSVPIRNDRRGMIGCSL
jgi:hypothetical protein